MAKSPAKKPTVSDQEFIEAFEDYLEKYLVQRSIEQVMACFGQKASGIGSALDEIGLTRNACREIFLRDIEQVKLPISIKNKKLKCSRVDDKTAVILCFGDLQGTAENVEFEFANFRISAVLAIQPGGIRIVHMHCSVPHLEEGLPQSYPIRLIKSALAETEDKYRQIFENAPVGLLHFDKNGIVRECNRKFQQIMDSSSEKIIGMNLLELKDEAASAAVKCALKGHRGFYEGYYRAHNSGKLVPLKAMLSPIFAGGLEVSGGVGIYEDISESKLAESKLHYQFQFEKIIARISSSFVSADPGDLDEAIVASLKLTSQFFDADRSYVFRINQDGMTAKITHEWEEPGVASIAHKYQRIDMHDLAGMGGFIDRSLDYIHIPDINNYPAELESVRYILAAGDVRSVLVLPLVFENRLIGCFGYDCLTHSRSWTYEEITLLKVVGEILANAFARQDIEIKLFESEKKYRLLSENASDVIWIADLDESRFLFVSPSVEKLLGCTAEEMLNEPLGSRLTPESAEYFFKAAAERLPLIDAGEELRFNEETMQVHQDGHLIPTEVTTSWIKDPVSQHHMVIGVSRDISLRKQAEEQRALLEMQRIQNQKADSIGRMAGAIAHHFNNQLQVISGNLELLSIGLKSDETLKKRVVDAEKAARKAAELSSLMLSYIGQAQSKNETIDLVDFCRRRLLLLQEMFAENIEISCQSDEKFMFVKADPSHLGQILTNVVANAVEAIGGRPGQVKISIKMVKAANIPVENRMPADWNPLFDSYGCLEVSDTGMGIQFQDVNKVYDPFFSTRFPGRGLGLAVALGFIRSMGGATSFSSQYGKGSVFSFFFNLCGPEELPLGAAESRLQAKRISGAVLLVEDEEIVRLICKGLLEHFNFKVFEATNGQEAIEIFRQHSDEIGLVICDMVMPGMNGRETISQIRAFEKTLPAILVSAYDQSYVLKQPGEVVDFVFLSKPYGTRSLMQAIRQAFGL